MIKFAKKVLLLCLLLCRVYIYEFPFSLGYAGDDEVRLRAEIYVPTSLIGRLVGKGGHNVRVMKRRKADRESNCFLSLFRFVNCNNPQVQL